MAKAVNLIGKRFGRLLVIKRVENDKRGQTKWLCQCDCGKQVEVNGYSLTHEKTKSCGCQRKSSAHEEHFENLQGKRFGKLVVLNREDNRKKSTMWECICDCGNKTITSASDLKSRKTQSCGCLKYESRNFTHNLSHTRLYKIWMGMKQRCEKSYCHAYKWYGERGISVCSKWKENFQEFYDWSMNNGYADNLTIDRIDVNGNYEPSNCRWIPIGEQARNTRVSKYITYKEETKSVEEWSRITGIKHNTLLGRLRSGYSDEECLEVPLCSRRGKRRN